MRRWLRSILFAGILGSTFAFCACQNTNNQVEGTVLGGIDGTEITELDPSWTPEWSGLVGYWKLDEPSGSSSVSDSSGQGNSGTPTGSMNLGAVGKLDGAANFSGGHINVGNPSVLNPTSAMTVTAWVNGSALSNAWPMIVAKGTNTQYLLLKDDDLSPAPFAFRIGSSATAVGTTAVQNNQWYYIAGTYDGSTIKIYVNGQVEGSSAYVGTIPVTTSDFFIGDWSGTGLPWNGLIDDVAVWNVALTATEIQTIYQRQSAEH